MRLPTIRGVHVATIALVAAMAALPGCSSSDNNSSGGSIALSLVPTSATVEAGGATVITGTLIRNSFTGDVGVTVEGAPTGVTGQLLSGGTNGSSTVTVSLGVAAGTDVGTYNLTVRAKGSGVTDATAPFTLTVVAASTTGYTLTLTPATLSLAEGSATTTAIALVRTNFAAGVTFSAENLPSGVTASFSPATASGLVDTVTLTASSTATIGSSSVVIRGVSPGVTDIVTPLALTVTAATAAGFSIASVPANLAVTIGGADATAAVTATRVGGFTGTITYTVTGQPAGLTAAIAATQVADVSTLTVGQGSGLVAGSYNLVVHANATGQVERTITIPVVVSAASGGSGLRLDYSACTTAQKPIYVAYQDGTTGTWTRATGSADVYSFNLVSAKGAIAVVTPNSGGTNYTTTVTYLAQGDYLGMVGGCAATPGTKTLSGTVAGLSSGDIAFFGLDGGSGTLTDPATTLSMSNLSSTGIYDLVGSKHPLTGTGNERGFIRRDVDLATTTTLGTLDFNGAESFAPSSATVTISNVPGGETVAPSVFYNTGATCAVNGYFTGDIASAGTNAFTVFGVPASVQRASDFHFISATATNGSSTALATQSTTLVAHSLTSETIGLPAALPAASVTATGSGPYKRLQTAITLPADFTSGTLTYTDNVTGNVMVIVVTPGYQAGSSALSIVAPDISAAAGFLATWEPATTSTVQWTLTGSATTVGNASSLCTEGATIKAASISGTTT
ncbi:MAG TPA: hypothetical protein VGM77_13585 [Gemmatimonadales bacterium]|jgi:hypothetical protein